MNFLYKKVAKLDIAYCPPLHMSYVLSSVCLYVGHSGEPYKNGWTDQDVVLG